MFIRCYIDITFHSIYLISVNLLDFYQLFFSLSFSFRYYGTLRRVCETSNLSNNAFCKYFVFENNFF